MSNRAKTILVVEDEELLRELFHEILSMHDHHVILKENGHTGMTYYQSHAHEIDLVILDLNLGDISGFKLYANISDINSSQKVIITSGDTQTKDIKDLARQDNVAILSKPFDNAMLVSLVNQLLER